MVALATPPPKQARPPRLANDPDRYIRRVKGGRYQCRPYCPVAQVRYTLPGTFGTVGEARKVLQEFWWGKRPDVPRFTREFHTATGTKYGAVVYWHGERYSAGRLFDTRAEAAAAAHAILVTLTGPLFAPAYLGLRDKGRGRAECPRR